MKTKILFALSAILATVGAFAANRVVNLGNGERVAIFDEAGIFSFKAPDNMTGTARILVVGGGGAGGGAYGAGGGGGQVVFAEGVELTPGDEYSVVVGAGGTGSEGQGKAGGTSSFLSYSAAGGGGGGGAWTLKDPTPGANGGGGSKGMPGGVAGVEGGYPGGSGTDRGGGGGGGAGGAGEDAGTRGTNYGGNGGLAVTNNITGELVGYGAGGGGYALYNLPDKRGLGGCQDGYGEAYGGESIPATAGRDGTGGGGGGGYFHSIAANGGSGTVVIRYTIDENQIVFDFAVQNDRGIMPHAVTFTARGDGGTTGYLTYTWDFGDGSARVTSEPTMKQHDATITHTYTQVGLYDVTVTATSADISATMTKEGAVHIFHPVIYVDAASENPVPPYATPATAATSLTNALSAVAIDGQTVRVSPGTYAGRWHYVTNAITVVGTGSSPSDTIITNDIPSTAWGVTNWVMFINNKDALVANLTITGGKWREQNGIPSGNLAIHAGVASNCVVRGGFLQNGGANANSGASAGVHLVGSNALLTHSTVEDCELNGNNAWSSYSMGAGASIASGARVENCLFRNINTTGGDIVTVTKGSIINSTIVDCTVNTWVHGGNAQIREKCYGLCLTNGTAVATNVVIANVRARDDASENRAIGGTPSKLESSVVNCATDTESPVNATCLAGTRGSFFKDGAYAPNASSLLRDAGVEIPRFANGVDLAGNPRVHGRGIDIGCYECQTAPGLTIFVR